MSLKFSNNFSNDSPFGSSVPAASNNVKSSGGIKLSKTVIKHVYD